MAPCLLFLIKAMLLPILVGIVQLKLVHSTNTGVASGGDLGVELAIAEGAGPTPCENHAGPTWTKDYEGHGLQCVCKCCDGKTCYGLLDNYMDNQSIALVGHTIIEHRE